MSNLIFLAIFVREIWEKMRDRVRNCVENLGNTRIFSMRNFVFLLVSCAKFGKTCVREFSRFFGCRSISHSRSEAGILYAR